MSRIIDIAQALAAALTAANMPAQVRGKPHTVQDQLTQPVRLVVPALVDYEDGDRSGYDSLYLLWITLQRRCAINDLEALDAALDEVQAIAALWGEGGALRSIGLAGAQYHEGPDHPTDSVYEHEDLENNLFTSHLAVTYGDYV